MRKRALPFRTLPAVLTMAGLLMWPDESPPWPATFFVAILGAIVGTIPMDREVFPRIAMRDLVRQVALGWLMRFLIWFIFLSAVAVMPNEFNWQVMMLAIAVIAWCRQRQLFFTSSDN